MMTKRDNEVIRKIRNGQWTLTSYQSYLTGIRFENECIRESTRILWRLVNGKDVTDEEIRFWWRAHKNKEFHYTKHWKKDRIKMVNYHLRWDRYITVDPDGKTRLTR